MIKSLSNYEADRKMTTTDYYNINAIQLIDRYNNTNMLSLHQLLLNHIPKNSTVLDIGFGSGRDLQFLYDNDYIVWGIDPSAKFVANAKSRFPEIQNKFFEVSVPFDKGTLKLNKEFDAVITIAMWMHLQYQEYEAVVESIVSVLNSSATVVISYSEGYRTDDGRYFENVDLENIIKLFKERGFNLVETIINGDSLKRDTLTWITVVFKND